MNIGHLFEISSFCGPIDEKDCVLDLKSAPPVIVSLRNEEFSMSPSMLS